MACVGLVSLLVLPAVFGLFVGGLLLLSWLSSMLLLLPVCCLDLGYFCVMFFGRVSAVLMLHTTASSPTETFAAIRISCSGTAAYKTFCSATLCAWVGCASDTASACGALQLPPASSRRQ